MVISPALNDTNSGTRSGRRVSLLCERTPLRPVFPSRLVTIWTRDVVDSTERSDAPDSTGYKNVGLVGSRTIFSVESFYMGIEGCFEVALTFTLSYDPGSDAQGSRIPRDSA